MVNKNSADTRKFEKEDKDIPKADEDGKPYRQHLNYEYINSLTDSSTDLSLWIYGTEDRTEYEITDFDFTNAGEGAEAGIPYPDDKVKNYTNGDDDDADALLNSIEDVKLFNFPNLYFVDMRQFTDEIIDACQVNGITDIFGLMELDDDATSNLTDILNDQQDCIEKFTGDIRAVINSLRDDISKARLPISKFDTQTVIGNYTALKNCTEDNIDKLCTYNLNPYNSSFKLVDDNDETDLSTMAKPSDLDEDIIAEVSGGDVENFEFPTITGAEEFASGIGDTVTLEVGQKATFEIIPRNSYDDPVDGDFSSKISINIISDTTGVAELVTENNISITREDTSYFGSIISNVAGKVLITAQVCNKTMKAFSYKGLVSTGGTATGGLTSCVTIPEEEDTNATPVGTVIKVDRVLTINFVDTGTGGTSTGGTGNSYTGGKSYTGLENLTNNFDKQTEPVTIPQEIWN